LLSSVAVIFTLPPAGVELIIVHNNPPDGKLNGISQEPSFITVVVIDSCWTFAISVIEVPY